MWRERCGFLARRQDTGPGARGHGGAILGPGHGQAREDPGGARMSVGTHLVARWQQLAWVQHESARDRVGFLRQAAAQPGSRRFLSALLVAATVGSLCAARLGY